MVYIMGDFAKNQRNPNTPLLHKSKRLLNKFFVKFRHRHYHKTPHYATNKSFIRGCFSITGAHVNRF